ncbi:MAG: hypothetical protein J7513_01655 [Solirubrobacteraceae bacterium]|nr:hypothetical protein [Solirubrobacteraceae bacterium]
MAREYVTQAELEAALSALQEPGRFDGAERLVSQAAPGLHRILLDALSAGGWGQDDDARAIEAALAAGDPEAVQARVRALLGEQNRVSMLVGVAVGVELARELGLADGEPPLTVTHHGSKEHH